MADSLVVNEIFASLQGESTLAGLPCIFVRLTACNLRCSYCDTAYAFSEGHRMILEEVIRQVEILAVPYKTPGANSQARLPLVELTGGEPLLQPAALDLMRLLCDRGFQVLLETNGAVDIGLVDTRVRRIMDLKCPGSGECDQNRWENLSHLRSSDEVKFVIGSWEDFNWSRKVIEEHHLAGICPLLFSWVHPQAESQSQLKRPPADHHPMTQRELAEAIVREALPVRFQLQMHKIIWPQAARGV